MQSQESLKIVEFFSQKSVGREINIRDIRTLASSIGKESQALLSELQEKGVLFYDPRARSYEYTGNLSSFGEERLTGNMTYQEYKRESEANRKIIPTWKY